MTVKELISKLQALNEPDLPVWIADAATDSPRECETVEIKDADEYQQPKRVWLTCWPIL